jgi:hypothetical protein
MVPSLPVTFWCDAFDTPSLDNGNVTRPLETGFATVNHWTTQTT